MFLFRTWKSHALYTPRDAEHKDVEWVTSVWDRIKSTRSGSKLNRCLRHLHCTPECWVKSSCSASHHAVCSRFWKAADDGSPAWFPPPTCKHFLALDLDLAQPSMVEAFREWTSWWKFSISPSVTLFFKSTEILGEKEELNNPILRDMFLYSTFCPPELLFVVQWGGPKDVIFKL